MLTKTEFKEHIAKRIRTVRKDQELTQVKLAEKAAISRAAVTEIERTQYSLSLHGAYKIAKGCGITLDELVGLSTPPGKSELLADAIKERFLRYYDQPISYGLIRNGEWYGFGIRFSIDKNDAIYITVPELIGISQRSIDAENGHYFKNAKTS